MVQKFHHTYGQLEKMTVPNLRALVQKHNYVNAIEGYSKMRKRELIGALIHHSPCKPGKKDKLSAKLVPGIHDPLYGKKGVAKGAREQFEKKHGKVATAKSPKKAHSFIELPKRRRQKPKRCR